MRNSRLVRRLCRLEKTLYRVLCTDSLKARRIGFTGLCVVVVTAVVLLLITGVSVQCSAPCDYMLMLDAGHRILYGQAPHVDFVSFAGPTAFLPVVLGMLAGGENASSLAYGSALLLPLLTFLAWRIAVRRVPPAVAFGFAVMVGGLLIGTFSLGVGYGWYVPSYAMQYNRLGWALLCMLALAVLVQPRSEAAPRGDIGDGISVGVCAGLLVFLKLNYAGAAILFLGLGCILYRRRPRFLLASVVAFLGVIGLCAVFLHGGFSAYARDLWMPLQVNAGGVHSRTVFAALNNLWELWAICTVVLLWSRPAFLPGQARKAVIPLVLTLLCAGVGVVIVAGNFQWYSVPLFAVAGIALAENFRRGWSCKLATRVSSMSPRSYRLRVGFSSVAVIAACLALAIPDFGSVGHSFLWQVGYPSATMSDVTIHADSLEGISFRETTHRNGSADPLARQDPNTPHGNATLSNDGLRLLQGHVDSHARILAMAFSNPFPFALQLPSPKGSPICIDGTHMSKLYHASAEGVFADVTHVMFQKPFTGSAAWEDIYGNYVRTHFVQIDESPLWILYVPRL